MKFQLEWAWKLASGETVVATRDRNDERVLLDGAEVSRAHRSTHRREVHLDLPERAPVAGDAPFRSGKRAAEIVVQQDHDAPKLVVDGALVTAATRPTRVDRVLTGMGRGRFFTALLALSAIACFFIARSAPVQWVYGRVVDGTQRSARGELVLDAHRARIGDVLTAHYPSTFRTADDGSLFAATNGQSVVFWDSALDLPLDEAPRRAIALTLEARGANHRIYGPDSKRLIEHFARSAALSMSSLANARGAARAACPARGGALEAQIDELGVPMQVTMCVGRVDGRTYVYGFVAPSRYEYRDGALLARIAGATEVAATASRPAPTREPIRPR